MSREPFPSFPSQRQFQLLNEHFGRPTTAKFDNISKYSLFLSLLLFVTLRSSAETTKFLITRKESITLLIIDRDFAYFVLAAFCL